VKRAVPAPALALLGGAAFLAWVPVIGLGFLSDSFLLPLLLDARGSVDWGRILSEWTHPWMGIRGGAAWRPLVTLHYGLDLSLFGISAPPLHLANLLVHLAAGLILFALLRRLLPKEGLWAAWVGAFLYLVHPARAEAVAWIAGRVDVTPALPAVLALFSFLRAAESGGRKRAAWTALSLLCASLAYAGKEMALALPAGLFFVEILRPRRERGFHPAGWILHLLLFAGVLSWRTRVLGGLTGGMAAGSLPAEFLSTLPGKARAAFLPPGPGRIPGWASLLFWVVLPLLAGLTRGRRVLPAAAVLFWWLLSLVPAAPVPVYPDWSGSRVLLFPALPAAVLTALLLGRPGKKADLWPLGSLRWIAGGGMCALALAGLLFRLQDWKGAWATAERAIRSVEAFPARPGGGPLGLVHLPLRPGGVHPFRYDCAFLAFRPPFTEKAREVLVLEDALLPPLLDAGPLHGAGRFCLGLLAWDPGLGAFTDQKTRGPGGGPIPLAGLRIPKGLGTVREGGLQVRAGKDGWTRLGLPLPPGPFRAVAGIRVRLEGAGPGTRLVLAWAPPGRGDLLEEGDPAERGPLFSCPLYPADEGRKVWIGACGDRVGFYGLDRWGEAVPLVLAVKGDVLVTSLSWLGTLPRLSWDPPARLVLDPSRPVFPLPPGLEGPSRLVILTPSRILTRVFRATGEKALSLDREGGALLGFLWRALRGGRIFFYFERLARLSDPRGVLARSLPAWAELGSPSTGGAGRGYSSSGGTSHPGGKGGRQGGRLPRGTRNDQEKTRK